MHAVFTERMSAFERKIAIAELHSFRASFTALLGDVNSSEDLKSFIAYCQRQFEFFGRSGGLITQFPSLMEKLEEFFCLWEDLEKRAEPAIPFRIIDRKEAKLSKMKELLDSLLLQEKEEETRVASSESIILQMQAREAELEAEKAAAWEAYQKLSVDLANHKDTLSSLSVDLIAQRRSLVVASNKVKASQSSIAKTERSLERLRVHQMVDDAAQKLLATYSSLFDQLKGAVTNRLNNLDFNAL